MPVQMSSAFIHSLQQRLDDVLATPDASTIIAEVGIIPLEKHIGNYSNISKCLARQGASTSVFNVSVCESKKHALR